MKMMNDNNRMHPEDIRNFILFAVLSLLLWYAFDHYVMGPKTDRLKQAQQTAAVQQQASSPEADAVPRDRAAVIAEAVRVTIANDAVEGSLSLRGARIDDLRLKKYFKTLDKKETVVLLSPAGTEHPQYAEFGWLSQEQGINLPGPDTEWKVSAGAGIGPGSSVTLTWDNGQGLWFERTLGIDDGYMISLTERVLNEGGKKVVLYPYALVAQHGIPEDFDRKSRIAHQGPIGYIGDKLVEKPYLKNSETPAQEFGATGGWIGVSGKYWFAGLVPDQEEAKTFRFIMPSTAKEAQTGNHQVDIVGAARILEPGQSAERTMRVFAGAKEIKILEKYEKALSIRHFDLVVDFGLYYFLTKPFFYTLDFLAGMTGNFGIALILMTIIVRAAVFPLANTSFRSFAKLKQVAPQMAELRATYGQDKKRLQEELVKLYEREKVNPMAGCLPILIQIPIFFALYKVLSVTIEMRHAPFYGWIHDLSVPDPTSVFNLFGLIPWTPPDMLMIGAWPCLMLAAMLVQRKLNPPPQDPMQAMMLLYMPFIMTYIMASFAAGLVVYWTFSNILSIVQQAVIMHSMGVEIHLFRRNKADQEMEELVKKGPSVHPDLEVIEDRVEEALFGTDAQQAVPVSKPKPRKKKKR